MRLHVASWVRSVALRIRLWIGVEDSSSAHVGATI